MFRKKADVGTKDVAALQVQIQDDIERYLEVEEVLGTVNHVPLVFPTDVVATPCDMEWRAKQVREQWGTRERLYRQRAGHAGISWHKGDIYQRT